MSPTRYFTHVDEFCDGTAYIEVGDFGTRIVSTSGAREDSPWTLDECVENCCAGVWRELSDADVLALNISAAPVDPHDAEIAALRAELARKDAALRRIAEGNLGDKPWQGDYGAIRTIAVAALQPKEPPCKS